MSGLKLPAQDCLRFDYASHSLVLELTLLSSLISGLSDKDGGRGKGLTRSSTHYSIPAMQPGVFSTVFFSCYICHNTGSSTEKNDLKNELLSAGLAKSLALCISYFVWSSKHQLSSRLYELRNPRQDLICLFAILAVDRSLPPALPPPPPPTSVSSLADFIFLLTPLVVPPPRVCSPDISYSAARLFVMV